ARRRLVRIGEPPVHLVRPLRAYLAEGQPLPLAEVALDEVVVHGHRRVLERLAEDGSGAGTAGQRRGDDAGDRRSGEPERDRARLRRTAVGQRYIASARVPFRGGQLGLAVAHEEYPGRSGPGRRLPCAWPSRRVTYAGWP